MSNKTGILKDKTMVAKMMYISNDDARKYPLCRLQLVVKTFENTT